MSARARVDAPQMSSTRRAIEIGRGEAWALLGAVVVILVFRAVYLAEYAHTLPFARSPVGDSLVYLTQAADVRLSRYPSPSLLALSPLYGYFLAATWGGGPPFAPLLVQAVLGVGTVVLCYLVVRGRFGALAAILSAGLLASYAVTYYFESKILAETLGLLLTFLCVAGFSSDAVRHARAGASLATGAAAGLAVLARASLIFCLPLFVLFALLPWARGREALTLRLRRAGFLSLGIAAVLLGNGLLNLHYSDRFVPVIMVSRTLESASGASYGGRLDHVSSVVGTSSPFDAVLQAQQELRRDADSQGPSLGLLARLARLDVGAILAHAPGKILRTFSNRENSHQYGYLAERAAIGSLGLLPGTFGLLMLWGIVGAVALVRMRGLPALWPYLPVVLGCLATAVLYHPSTRYRLAMIAPAILLSGLGVRALLAARTRRPVWALLVLLGCASLGLVVHGYNLGSGNLAEWELQLAASYGLGGDPGQAAEHARAALAHAPEDPSVAARAVPIIEAANGSPILTRPPE